MFPLLSAIRKHASDLAPRTVWLLLAVAHVPGWYRAAGLGGDFDLSRLLILTASLLFFALKIADVGWLRFPTSARFWVVLCAVVVLMHADVLRRTSAHALEFAEPAVPATLILAALVFVAAGLHRRPGSAQGRCFDARARATLAELLSAAHAALLPPRDLMLARAGPSDRAPPVR